MSDDDESASECDSDTEKLEYTAAAMQQDDPFFTRFMPLFVFWFRSQLI